MDIKTLAVRRFRGINYLDWNISGRLLCLVGPCDSTKSTILEAIQLALTPRRSLTFDDADFYNSDTSEPILIEITMGGVPKELLSDAKFGYLIRGYTGSVIHDEPQDTDEPILTIRLAVDETLEPTWRVVNERIPEGKPISAFDRGKLGVARIGQYVDWQLSWSQGSAITRLMEQKQDVRPILASARRNAKSSLNLEDLPLLKESAKNAEYIGKKLGVAPSSEQGYQPHLDIRSVSIGASILALHDGPIPLRQAGLGTSRLLTMGLQHEATRDGGIILIDEIEHGLEPHRIRRVLNVLRTGTRLQEPSDPDESGNDSEFANQVFLTTHSPIALSELEPAELRITRCENGTTEIKTPADELRPLLRTNPEAFLSRAIIVCEGKTEIGLCRALDHCWSNEDKSFAYVGASLANGEGNTKGPAAAIHFADLGYKTAFFGDSDEPINPDQAVLTAAGVRVILWDGAVATEERIALDLPWDGFVEMVCLVIEEFGRDHVQSKLATQITCDPGDVPQDPEQWRNLLSSEADIRSAFAKAAKAKKAEWFKRVDRAQRLGELVIRYRSDLTRTSLNAGIKRLKEWVYD
jgi:putative ATP-dependent endonuclease of the OLD family